MCTEQQTADAVRPVKFRLLAVREDEIAQLYQGEQVVHVEYDSPRFYVILMSDVRLVRHSDGPGASGD